VSSSERGPAGQAWVGLDCRMEQRCEGLMYYCDCAYAYVKHTYCTQNTNSISGLINKQIQTPFCSTWYSCYYRHHIHTLQKHWKSNS